MSAVGQSQATSLYRANDRDGVVFCHSNDRRPVLDTGFGFSFSPVAK
jgi:hypothetical protein